jgi:hypothetical protein
MRNLSQRQPAQSLRQVTRRALGLRLNKLAVVCHARTDLVDLIPISLKVPGRVQFLFKHHTYRKFSYQIYHLIRYQILSRIPERDRRLGRQREAIRNLISTDPIQR